MRHRYALLVVFPWRCLGKRRIHHLQRRSGSYPPQLRGGSFRGAIHLARYVQENERYGRARFSGRDGTVDVLIDTTTVDFAHDKLKHMFRVRDAGCVEVPDAEYKGNSWNRKRHPKTISGNLTLHGVTKPVTLNIKFFKCMSIPCSRSRCAAPMPAARSTALTSVSITDNSMGSSRTSFCAFRSKA